MAADLVEIPSRDSDTILVIFLLQVPEDTAEQAKTSLSTPDEDWDGRPSIDAPSISIVPWTRSSEGRNADLYRIAVQAKNKNHSSLIFIDGKFQKDGSVLMTRMLDSGKLSVRRAPAERATLALKDCDRRGERVSQAPVGRFDFGILRGDLIEPFQVPFRVDGTIGSVESDKLDLRSLTSIPETIQASPGRPVVASLTPKATVADLLRDNSGKEDLSEADVDFYPWTGSLDGTRADLCRIFNNTSFVHPVPAESRPSASFAPSQLYLIEEPDAEGEYSLIYAKSLGKSQGKAVRIHRLPVTKLRDAWSNVCGFYRKPIQIESNLLNIYNNQEFIANPDGYMYAKDQPLWESDNFLNYGGPPVFYLVKLSADDDKVVREELGTFSDIEENLLENGDMDEIKTYSFVPWEQDEDGTELDMLRIARMTGLSEMIFIDRQSVKDLSVILTDGHLEYDKDENGREIFDTAHSHNLGLDWGRSKGKEARLSWINLDIANMDLEECIEDDEPIFSSFDLLEKRAGDDKDVEGHDLRNSTKRNADEEDEEDGPRAKVAKV